MDAKQLVTDYYNSDAFRNSASIDKFMHDGLLVKWHSSKGYLELDKDDLIALTSEMAKSYSSSRIAISHLIAEGDTVSVRYTHYVNTIENPWEEMVLAHFVMVWEVKDDKLYRGYLMSQLG